MAGIVQYLKDKLLLGEREIDERDIGIYIKPHSANPSITDELRSELNQASLGASLASRRYWFERAAKSVMESRFSGVRLEIALQLLEEQIQNPFTYTLAFKPEKLKAEIKEQFLTEERYYEHLSEI